MRKPSAPTITEPAPDGWTYLGIAVFLPALTGYSLYLAGDYFALLQLIHMPGFWSLNPFQASFVACGPAMLLFCVLGNVKLFLSATLPIPLARRLITAIAWLTLGLLFTLNALTLFCTSAISARIAIFAAGSRFRGGHGITPEPPASANSTG